MTESSDAAEGKAYRQSPDGADLLDAATGRLRRVARVTLILLGLALLVLAAVMVVRDWDRPAWQPAALAGVGVIIAVLAAALMGGVGRLGRTVYRFDDTSSRALNTLGRMHGKD